MDHCKKFFVLTALFLFSCQPNSDEGITDDPGNPMVKENLESTGQKYYPPITTNFWKWQSDIEEPTSEEVEYYFEELDYKYAGKSYLDNLKSMTIYMLLNDTDFLQTSSLTAKKKYLNVMVKEPGSYLLNKTTFYKLLRSAKSELSDQEYDTYQQTFRDRLLEVFPNLIEDEEWMKTAGADSTKISITRTEILESRMERMN